MKPARYQVVIPRKAWPWMLGVALEAAAAARRSGFAAEVLVEGADRRRHVRWSCDPEPATPGSEILAEG